MRWRAESAAPASGFSLPYLLVGVLLEQIHCAVGQLEKVRMRAIAVGHDGEAEFPVAVAQQKSSVARDTAAMSEIAVAVARLHPPCHAEAGGLVSPDAFHRPFELIVLAREHLLKRLLADDPLAFEDTAVEVGD